MASLNKSNLKIQEIDSSLELDQADKVPFSNTVILPAKETDDSMDCAVS